MRSLKKCAEIYLYKSLGSKQIKSYPRVTVVLAWQEGRLNFYLTVGRFMSGELPQLPLSPFRHEHLVLLSVPRLCLGGESCCPPS